MAEEQAKRPRGRPRKTPPPPPKKQEADEAESDALDELEAIPEPSADGTISVTPDAAKQLGAADVEAIRANRMVQRRVRDAAAGKKGPVLVLEGDPESKFETVRQILRIRGVTDARVTFKQVSPVTDDSLDPKLLSEFPRYDDLLRYIRDTFWDGRDAVFRWDIRYSGNLRGGGAEVRFKNNPAVAADREQRLRLQQANPSLALREPSMGQAMANQDSRDKIIDALFDRLERSGSESAKENRRREPETTDDKIDRLEQMIVEMSKRQAAGSAPESPEEKIARLERMISEMRGQPAPPPAPASGPLDAVLARIDAALARQGASPAPVAAMNPMDARLASIEASLARIGQQPTPPAPSSQAAQDQTLLIDLGRALGAVQQGMGNLSTTIERLQTQGIPPQHGMSGHNPTPVPPAPPPPDPIQQLRQTTTGLAEVAKFWQGISGAVSPKAEAPALGAGQAAEDTGPLTFKDVGGGFQIVYDRLTGKPDPTMMVAANLPALGGALRAALGEVKETVREMSDGATSQRRMDELARENRIIARRMAEMKTAQDEMFVRVPQQSVALPPTSQPKDHDELQDQIVFAAAAPPKPQRPGSSADTDIGAARKPLAVTQGASGLTGDRLPLTESPPSSPNHVAQPSAPGVHSSGTPKRSLGPLQGFPHVANRPPDSGLPS